MHFRLSCLNCGAEQSPAARSCGNCGSMLGYSYDLTHVEWDDRFRGSIWRYWRLLPITDPSAAVTLGEGGTPLLQSRLHPNVALFWKDETRNPTGSHKDRALALALSEARACGARRSVVVSAGSTGLSNAAYAARAGIAAVNVMSIGAPTSRVAPIAVYGARLIEVEAGIDDLIEATQRFHGNNGIYVASTTRRCNPCQAEASKTIAYEIVEELGEAPDWVICPAGGGGTLASLWRGFQEMQTLGRARRLPKLAAVVPQSYDALAQAFARDIVDEVEFKALPYPDDVPTLLTKLAHAHAPDGPEALAAVRASGGTVIAVDDNAAVAGTLRSARVDGLYLEPSSGVVAAALDRMAAADAFRRGETVVALACGLGFRETTELSEAMQVVREVVQMDALYDLFASDNALT